MENNWLRRHDPTTREVADLLRIAEGTLRDAEVEQVSADTRYVCAYKAARCLCDLALRAEGYQVTKGQGSHKRVIESLEHTLGSGQKAMVAYLDLCSRKRNQLDYDIPGTVGTGDVEELVAKAKELRDAVLEWLNDRHPELVPPEPRKEA